MISSYCLACDLSLACLLVEKTMQKIQHSQAKYGVCTVEHVACFRHGNAGFYYSLAELVALLMARSPALRLDSSDVNENPSSKKNGKSEMACSDLETWLAR